MRYDELKDINLIELIEKETGDKFNAQKFIKCPFHAENTPSLSVKYNSNANKERFKCFGCEESGDAIDFIMKFKGLDYKQAREYLGLSVEKSEIEAQAEKIHGEIKKNRKGQKLLALFPFVDQDNKPKYFKAKFALPEGGKALSYYYVEGNRVINKRGTEELPYNLHNVLEGIRTGKTIVICEGEKDANTLNKLLDRKRYATTSVKDVKDLSILRGASIYVCGDTGKAGEKYINNIKKTLQESATHFKVINLPGIEELGDNKDVTDWIESGHTGKDLLEAFKRSLDLNSTKEFQQDDGGVYKFKEEKEVPVKKYISNFKVLSASNIKYVDDNTEGVRLVLKTSLGDIIERSGVVTVFDDVRAFRNFLNSMDLAFYGKLEDLIIFKLWIKKYFTLKDEKIYSGTKFLYEDEKVKLITPQGTLSNDNVINKNISSDGGAAVNIAEVKPITQEELQELMKYLFKFSDLAKSYSIIGTIINNFAVAQAIKANIKLHHLLIVGESGSGKSTILKNVIAAILNYPENKIRPIGLITPHAMMKVLSTGNFQVLFDEYKPSMYKKNKQVQISELLRNLYDRTNAEKGKPKDLKRNYEFSLICPVIIAGEESYPSSESALMHRTCIVYLSKGERTSEHTVAMKWISENQDLLNRLGRSLIDEVLSLSVEEYKRLREEIEVRIHGLKDRPYQTAINICCGIEIFNKFLRRHDIEEIKVYEPLIAKNIVLEVLENNDEVLSQVEKMLLFYNDMIENERTRLGIYTIQTKGKQIYIKTVDMIEQISEHARNVNSDLIVLSKNDFKKQAERSGYLIKKNIVIKVNSKAVRYDLYNANKLKKLRVDAIVQPDFREEDWEPGERNIVFPEFNKS